MESEWMSILVQIVAAISAVFISCIGIAGAFYMKRLDNKLKQKSLTDEIKKMVDWSGNSRTFKALSYDDQLQSMVEQMQQFSTENGITVTDRQLIVLIESAMNYPLKMEGEIGKFMLTKKEIHNVRIT